MMRKLIGLLLILGLLFPAASMAETAEPDETPPAISTSGAWYTVTA